MYRPLLYHASLGAVAPAALEPHFVAAHSIVHDIESYNDHLLKSDAAPPELLEALLITARLPLHPVSSPQNMRYWDKSGGFLNSLFVISGYQQIPPDGRRVPIAATIEEVLGLVDGSFTPYPSLQGSLAHKPTLRRVLAVPECRAVMLPVIRAVGGHCLRHRMDFNSKQEKQDRLPLAYGLWAAHQLLARSIDKHDPDTYMDAGKKKVNLRYLRPS